MKPISTSIFFTLVAAVSASIKEVERYQGKTTGRYIIALKEDASRTDFLQRLSKDERSASSITELDIINGWSGYFDDDALHQFRIHPEVALIAEDGIMHTTSTIVQTDAPWGIARLSSQTRLTGSDSWLNFTYTYDSSAGGCADVYVVDTGIYTDHVTFGGRAKWGATFGNYTSADGSGHGTHCAGTVAGTQYGVSKAATVYAVKVLDDAGSGSTTDIVNGLNWVLNNARSTGRPSIVSITFGGGISTPVDNAVATLTSAGIHVVVAAGNSNIDAANTSPARSPSAVTVGAITFADSRAMFSNYGSVVDIFAPGQNIISAWIGSTTATNNLSGTSTATPHIAGLIAYLICLEGNVSPAAMSTKIKSKSLKGVISSIPSGTLNDLGHIG